MATITADMIKVLRERTGVGMGKCKEALETCGGDMEKAIDHLRKLGIASAVKKMQKLAEQVEKEFNHIESQQVEEDRKDKKYLKTLLESIPKKPEVILMWSSS